ncbi:MAG: cytochrome B [Rhodobacteraceae bacterium]|nr:cytochrome B [Paracoccaceae bacterium]
MPTPKGYSLGQIRLHWIVALLLVPQFILHDTIKADFIAIGKGEAISFSPLLAAHIFGGIALLLLMIWRLALRARRGAPRPPADEPAALQAVAKAVHVALYAILLLLPLSGLFAWFGHVNAAAQFHELMKLPLLALVGLHVLGALYHQFVLKNGLIERMKRAG